MVVTKKHLELFFIIVLFLGLRLPGLGEDITNSDGPRWHRRSERFLTALKQGDLKATYQHYQPGVTLMWLNAFVKQAAFSYQLTHTSQPKTLENADWYPIIHGISKAFVVVVLCCLLLFQLRLLSRLFSWRVAFFYGFLMSVEPYVLGIDRWFHLTSLETTFAFSSFLSILLWLDSRKSKFLFISATLFALAVLSKLTSLILAPLFLVVFLLHFKTRKDFYFMVLFGVVACWVFVLLFPALWVSPLPVLQKLLHAVTGAVGTDIRATQLVGINPFIYYFLILAFKLTPISLLLLLFAGVFFKRTLHFKYVRYIFLFFVVYYIFLTIPAKKIDRYAISLFPSLLLLISIFVESLPRRVFFGLVGAYLLFVCYMVYFYKPVYSAYYSPILGGTSRALSAGIYENSGEYFAQAAMYLNTLGRDNYTFVPHNKEAFSYYYKGNLQVAFDATTDFVVQSLDIDRVTPDFKACPHLLKSFGPVDKGVVFVYDCR